MGFKDLSDLWANMLGWKTGLFAFFQICGSCMSVGVSFIESYVWTPASGAVFFAVMVLAESMTGTYVAVTVKKEKFDFRKFYNVAPKLVAHILLLAFAYNIGQYMPLLVWFPNAVFGWFATRNFIAIMINLVELKLVKGEFAQFIKGKLKVEDKELAESIERDLKK